jgi:hypothetical protein
MMSPRKQSGIREIEPRQKIVKEMGELVAELNEDIKSNPFKRTFEPGDDDTKSLVAYLDYLNTILLQLYSGFWGADYA